jgi:exosortase/archaeosortase family protein
VPTATRRPETDAARFALRGLATSLGLFGVLRLSWLETHVVLPVTRLQAQIAVSVFGGPAAPVEATLACSGTDAIALCLGAILAYPVPWRVRAAGGTAGLALILGLNVARIGTLGRAAASTFWFDALHLYAWPAVLTLAIAGYVFGWMRYADRPHLPAASPLPTPSLRFAGLTIVFLLIFLAASPLYLQSPAVLALAGVVTRAAALMLDVFGVTVHAAGNVLTTPRGGFAVTQECVSTPLIPVYLAAVCAYSPTWKRLCAGVLAAVPVFIGLGILRLLVLVLPANVASPEFLIHAFSQLAVAAIVVLVAAFWRHGRTRGLAYAGFGILAGVLFVRLLGPLYTALVTSDAHATLPDPQGAIAFLPAFQVGLYLALWAAAFAAVAWRRVLAGLALLGLTQAAGLLALSALATHAGVTAHVRDIRGWAIAGPLLVLAAVVGFAQPRR